MRALVTPITPKLQIYTKIIANFTCDARFSASYVKFLKKTVCIKKKV